MRMAISRKLVILVYKVLIFLACERRMSYTVHLGWLQGELMVA